MKQKSLKLEELEHCPLRQWAFPSEGVRGCYYQTMAKLQTGSVTQLHGTVYLWLLDEAGGALWPKPASPWLVPAPSLTEPLEATGWALAVLASLLDDLGGCQILEVTYWGACAAPAGLGDRDYKAVRKWGISLVTAGGWGTDTIPATDGAGDHNDSADEVMTNLDSSLVNCCLKPGKAWQI